MAKDTDYTAADTKAQQDKAEAGKTSGPQEGEHYQAAGADLPPAPAGSPRDTDEPPASAPGDDSVGTGS